MTRTYNKRGNKVRVYIPESEIPDELNKDLIFHMTHTDLLVKALSGEIDILECIRKELSARGLNEEGQWVGFKIYKFKN